MKPAAPINRTVSARAVSCFMSFPFGQAKPPIRSGFVHGGITSNHTGRPR
jgi:hypothetical protein